MEFAWDAAKNARNIELRGLPFGLAKTLLAGPVLNRIDDRRDYGETRLRAVGRAGTDVLVCIYTIRGDVIRVISLRRANRRERDAHRALQGE